MIKNNKNTVGVADHDAAIEALTFDDLNEVCLPVGFDVHELQTMPHPSLDKPSFIEQKDFKGSFSRPASRNIDRTQALLPGTGGSLKVRS